MANNYPVLRKRFAFAAGVEATPGTPETLAWNTHAIRLLSITKPEPDYLSPNTTEGVVTGNLGNAPDLAPAGKFYSSQIRWALMPAGSAYSFSSEASKNVPECHPLLRAAGYGLSVGSSIATYSLSDDPVTAITAWMECAGKKYIFTYAVIDGLTIEETAGSYPVMSGRLIGVCSSEAEADLDAATYDAMAGSTAPPIMKGSGSLVVGSYQPQFQSLTVSLNTVAQPNLSGNATDGHAGYRIVSRGPTAVLNARVVAAATWDPRADVDARTSRTLDTVCGSTQYSRVKLDMDAVAAQTTSLVEDGDYWNYSVAYKINEATATCNVVWD
jgi:hypothetical protein